MAAAEAATKLKVNKMDNVAAMYDLRLLKSILFSL
jgi:hypothetical protein